MTVAHRNRTGVRSGQRDDPSDREAAAPERGYMPVELIGRASSLDLALDQQAPTLASWITMSGNPLRSASTSGGGASPGSLCSTTISRLRRGSAPTHRTNRRSSSVSSLREIASACVRRFSGGEYWSKRFRINLAPHPGLTDCGSCGAAVPPQMLPSEQSPWRDRSNKRTLENEMSEDYGERQSRFDALPQLRTPDRG